VNAKKIEAKYESGILRVVLPKNEQKKLSKLVDIL
jgi:HSP20 family molecular chaperone IbpA